MRDATMLGRLVLIIIVFDVGTTVDSNTILPREHDKRYV